MLITFEGIDGAGKSTQIQKLAAYLKQEGREVLTLREPGGTEVAEKIRHILLESRHDITPVGELLLFSASRAELVSEVVRPALAEGKTVILDRFFDSTTAYQGYGRGLDLNMLRTLIAISTGALTPDITFYLDILPEEALIRKFSEKSLPLAFENEELDRMERSGLEFYRNVRQGYLDIIEAEPGRFKSINARHGVQEIHAIIVKTLNERFKEQS
ncbi:dTMP kinase [Pelodictyon luteolum]|uniref:Thymidylate kinase n=1 Tax=Chlorobium luteolum (strain DSM 273 / BCRC 81028 / 2530) TaxID=319225 RepID=KTHY_CHLL3|nr:dTMP kinase [Pelodictyon luteolum]Q3B3B1.1 RecName: Full=Thymidylate kinase; AltName: Full=dTMP kinase [Pelodictyon luteolum DSM 273]ABB24170.1 thymidylate kinase [Pelodictyon luteolum DSM 273]